MDIFMPYLDHDIVIGHISCSISLLHYTHRLSLPFSNYYNTCTAFCTVFHECFGVLSKRTPGKFGSGKVKEAPLNQDLERAISNTSAMVRQNNMQFCGLVNGDTS